MIQDTLWNAPFDVVCVVDAVQTTEKIRLYDLGFYPKSEVIPLHQSSTGNTKLYLIKDTLIALRQADCEKIVVNWWGKK